jgi:hypothetical protein
VTGGPGVWASPMATGYLDADVPALLRLSRLQDVSTGPARPDRPFSVDAA